MANHSNGRRIWTTNAGTVCLRDRDEYGDPIIREFWVPASGGYVREIDARHPGASGQQVCGMLASRGATLESSREGLLDLIRREYRRAVAYDRRESR
jgi:hypothetical protein